VGVCACVEEGEDSGRIRAVATTTQLADFVRNVGGDRVDVDQILGANVDAHDYEFVPSDVEAVAESDIVFQAGFDLDEWLSELIDNAGGERPVIDTSEGVTATQGVDEGDSEDDPHIWFDPANVPIIVDNIAEALTEIDPDGADSYRDNAERYKGDVLEMDTRVEEIFAACESDELKLVTSHDAFGRFAERYGLQIVGAVIPSSTQTALEPSAQDVAELIGLIEEEEVGAIFSEASIDTELSEQIADETGAIVVADLYADSLGPEGSGAETYIEMMEYNAQHIVDGLDCA
jgi:zinc/manganese transport system substrate-binding protein